MPPGYIDPPALVQFLSELRAMVRRAPARRRRRRGVAALAAHRQPGHGPRAPAQLRDRARPRHRPVLLAVRVPTRRAHRPLDAPVCERGGSLRARARRHALRGAGVGVTVLDRHAGPTRTTLRVSGRDVTLLRGGEGPTLLYLHGLCDVHAVGPDDQWTPFLAHLAAHFDVTAPALPGYNASTGLEDFDDVEDYVWHLVDVCQAAGARAGGRRRPQPRRMVRRRAGPAASRAGAGVGAAGPARCPRRWSRGALVLRGGGAPGDRRRRRGPEPAVRRARGCGGAPGACPTS